MAYIDDFIGLQKEGGHVVDCAIDVVLVESHEMRGVLVRVRVIIEMVRLGGVHSGRMFLVVRFISPVPL